MEPVHHRVAGATGEQASYEVDTPACIQRWWEIVDDVTTRTGLVTSEIVPAVRATGGGVQRGGLALAQHGG